MIRDPQFWNRFSVAVHQDDLEKQLTSQNPKHSYVISSSPMSPAHSPLGSPTSQIHLPPSSPGQPPMVQLSSLRSSIMSTPLSPLSVETPLAESPVTQTKRSSIKWPTSKKTRSSYLQKTPSTRPLLRPDISSSTTANQRTNSPPLSSDSKPAAPPSGPHHQHHLDSSLPASPSRAFFRSPNFSTVSLSFSGRPASRFKFVTTITADASHRDSWLVRQKKKERHRTWLCWTFWIAFLALVAAVVATVLVLKSKRII